MFDQVVAFCSRIRKDVYQEKPFAGGTDMVSGIVTEFLKRAEPKPYGKMLDVGCGRGEALNLFWHRWPFMEVYGVTLGSGDAENCFKQGHDIAIADQTFLPVKTGIIDLCWVRHCLEHSPWPYMTLLELKRVMKDDGYLYIEVPTVGQKPGHEFNQNHYSVLTEEMWASLVWKSGFQFHCNRYYLNVDTEVGKDKFLCMICRKGEDVLG